MAMSPPCPNGGGRSHETLLDSLERCYYKFDAHRCPIMRYNRRCKNLTRFRPIIASFSLHLGFRKRSLHTNYEHLPLPG